jgi:peptidoglycan/LPS O-acetylase OafA/YrhL
MSYSLYIWQQFFFSKPALFGWSSPAFLQFPFCFIGALACATGSYYLLEKPLLQLRKRLSLADSQSPIQS